jgi:hypothetical protein
MIAPDKADHEIKIKITQDPNNAEKRHAVAEMPEGGLRVGKTVSYSCPDGRFSLEFPDGALFGVEGVKTVTNSEILKLVKAGQFECRCSITPTDRSPEIKWSPGDPQSGGAHDVQD